MSNIRITSEQEIDNIRAIVTALATVSLPMRKSVPTQSSNDKQTSTAPEPAKSPHSQSANGDKSTDNDARTNKQINTNHISNDQPYNFTQRVDALHHRLLHNATLPQQRDTTFSQPRNQPESSPSVTTEDFDSLYIQHAPDPDCPLGYCVDCGTAVFAPPVFANEPPRYPDCQPYC